MRGAKYWQDIYHWGAGLTVTGRLRDIRQSVLRPFQAGSSSSPVHCHSFFLIILLEGAFNRNVISILCINYNNAVINNNYGRLQDLILGFKTSLGTWKGFFEIYRQFRLSSSKWFASTTLVPTLRLHYSRTVRHVLPRLMVNASLCWMKHRGMKVYGK
jgi:hypothetical protein